MSGFNLSEKDRENIRKSAEKAEKTTSGEIVTAIIKESSDYAFYELAAALIGGFLVYMAGLYFHTPLAQWLDSLFWDTEVSFPAFLGGIFLAATGLLYLAANIPGADRLIVPASVIRKNVRQRALAYFTEAGVSQTRDRTGILIFISYREKRIELIADTGISALIPEGNWESIVNSLVDSIKRNEPAKGLSSAIEECGKLLAEHFPIKKDDTDELSNDLNILED